MAMVAEPDSTVKVDIMMTEAPEPSANNQETKLLNVKRLVKWAESHGANFSKKIEVFNFQDSGIGLRAKSKADPKGEDANAEKAIKNNAQLAWKGPERIVSCPFKCSLSFLNALNVFPQLPNNSPGFDFPDELLQSSLENSSMIGNFFLMLQYLMKDRSFWSDYIISLPQPSDMEFTCTTPLYYSQDDKEYLKGTNLEVAVEEREGRWKAEFDEGSRILKTAEGLAEFHEKWEYELYKWAATIFSSRSFVSNLIPKEVFSDTDDNLEGAPFKIRPPSETRITKNYWQARLFDPKVPFPVLFPLVDLANHDSAARATWFTNPNTQIKDLSIIIESDITEGDQIFNNYGPKGNTELLLGYGFMIPGNDSVTVQFKQRAQDLLKPLNSQSSLGKRHHENAPNDRYLVTRPRTKRDADEGKSFLMYALSSFDSAMFYKLAQYVCNDGERRFMERSGIDFPDTETSRLERDGTSRIVMNVISILQEKLNLELEKLITTGAHLRLPKTPAQRNAANYRHGQIEVLVAARSPLDVILDRALFEHVYCDHHVLPKHIPAGQLMHPKSDFELIRLDCAYSWLQNNWGSKFDTIARVIESELELERFPGWDWSNPDVTEWGFTLWVLFIYLIVAAHLTNKSARPTGVMGCLKRLVLDRYILCNESTRDGTWTLELFNGDPDEQEILENIIDSPDLNPGTSEHTSSASEKVLDQRRRHKILNFASLFAREECFMVGVPKASSQNNESFGVEEEMRYRQMVIGLHTTPTDNGSPERSSQDDESCPLFD